ncbi:MAG: crossover junction endodeoxyribonuclease [Betaproteobacteria bacterium]|nr:crossover junction endodeoxyribonuclease [Betaproteobacteria bacterium]
MTVIIGLDPGVSGAVGVLTESGKFVDVFDMPTVLANKSSNRQMVNAYELANLLRSQLTNAPADVVAITEGVNAMPEQGVSSVFAFGKSYGILLGVLAALGISTHIVSPAKWKAYFALGREKDQSRELAQRMWPAAPLGLKKHHNRAEALMLARYYAEAVLRPLPNKPF